MLKITIEGSQSEIEEFKKVKLPFQASVTFKATDGMGSIADAEILAFGKFSEYEIKIIKEQYATHPIGTFPNPTCALHS